VRGLALADPAMTGSNPVLRTGMTGNNLFKNQKTPLEASVPRGNGGHNCSPAHGREIYPKNISLSCLLEHLSF